MQVVTLNIERTPMTKQSLNSPGLIRFVPSSIGILLAILVFVAFPSSSAFATQCEEVEFTETGNCCIHNIYVSLSTGTSGATIFVTYSQWGPPATPTHNESTPGYGTQVYNPMYPIVVMPGNRMYFKAIAYKAGFTDSVVAEHLVENY